MQSADHNLIGNTNHPIKLVPDHTVSQSKAKVFIEAENCGRNLAKQPKWSHICSHDFCHLAIPCQNNVMIHIPYKH